MYHPCVWCPVCFIDSCVDDESKMTDTHHPPLCLQLSRGRFWLRMNERESFTRRRGTSLRATLKRSTTVRKPWHLMKLKGSAPFTHSSSKILVISQNQTRGPERAPSSGGSSTTTGCILHRSTTVTPSEAERRDAMLRADRMLSVWRSIFTTLTIRLQLQNKILRHIFWLVFEPCYHWPTDPPAVCVE